MTERDYWFYKILFSLIIGIEVLFLSMISYNVVGGIGQLVLLIIGMTVLSATLYEMPNLPFGVSP
jgi:ABC-type multidrug transport system permease subunit